MFPCCLVLSLVTFKRALIIIPHNIPIELLPCLKDEGLTDAALMLAVLLLLLPVVALCIASSLGDDTGHTETVVSQDKVTSSLTSLLSPQSYIEALYVEREREREREREPGDVAYVSNGTGSFFYSFINTSSYTL